jgi:hypothetical protein
MIIEMDKELHRDLLDAIDKEIIAKLIKDNCKRALKAFDRKSLDMSVLRDVARNCSEDIVMYMRNRPQNFRDIVGIKKKKD